MFGKFCSIISGGCLIIFIIIVGGSGLLYYLIKTKGVSGVVGGFDRRVTEISADDQQKLDEKLANFGKLLEAEDKSALLILSEKEAAHLLSSNISGKEMGGLDIFENIDFDFEPDVANIYASGPYNSDFKIELFIEKDNDSVVPVAKKVNLGRLSLPAAAVDRINDGIFQAVEQMKTENMGSIKVSNVRIMKDSVVIEVEKI